MYLEEAALERQLPELDLRMLVDLPPGLDYNEWLASHTLALFDHINLIYGTISEFCTMTGCPDMTGPGLRCVSHIDTGRQSCLKKIIICCTKLFLMEKGQRIERA